MKNQTKWAIPDFRVHRLLLLIMKGYLLFFCTLAMGMHTDNLLSQQSVYVETDKVLTVDQVFDLIMEQTDYNFIYQVDLFKDKPKVHLKKGKIKVDKLLERSLSNSAVTLDVTDSNTIVIQPTTVLRGEQQDFRVNGRVTDAEGIPLPGATVRIKGMNRGVATDFDGNYTITVPGEESMLVFTSIGYQMEEVVVGNQRTINVQLAESVSELDEVVVNAGYYKVSDREKTGSISKISAEAIERQPITNVIGTMQGQMAGVNIVQESGIAGGGFRVNIRGVNSLREDANQPLYLIDGVPYSSDPISDQQTSSSIPGDGNPLASINPNDIESIEVLKDADATAIYGSRGANGVVLITTKRGEVGKPTFTMNTTHGFGQVTRMMDLMDTEQYLAMRREAFANDGITEYPLSAYDVNGTWDQSRFTDWQEELYGGTSEIHTWQLSARGGSESTTFLVSGNYRTESSVFPGDFVYRKGGAHVSFSHAPVDGRFQLEFSGSYTVQDNDLPWTDFVTISRQLAPNAPALYDENGDLNWENGTWQNPLGNLESKSLALTNDLITNMVLSYKLGSNVVVKSNFGFTDLQNEDSRSLPTTMYNPSYNLTSQYSSIYQNSFQRRSWIVEPQVHWNLEIGKSKINLIGGVTFQQQKSKKLLTYASGFNSNSLLYDLASASSVLVRDNARIDYNYQAFFGRLNYSLFDKYFLNLTARRDGSSRFGPGRQFANFGAVGGAWLFHKEPFVEKNLPFLSFGKLRASYGTTGSDQIGDYQYLDTYTSSGIRYGGASGLYPERLYNDEFGWETNRKFETALELGLFKDRVFLTTAFYLNRSSNQLVGFPLPGTTGFTSIQDNLDATVENKGFEATLRTINVKGKNFSWTTDVNLTLAGNKLVSFPGLEYSSYRQDYVIGEPTTVRKLFRFTGVDPETGLYQFEDVNNDGAITYEDDRETVKDVHPEFFGGLHNQIGFKGLQLNFLLQFVKQENFNFANTHRFTGFLLNQPVDYVDSWHQVGDNAPYQRFTSGANQQARQASEFFSLSDGAVSDASFIRLKTLSLSYDLPKDVLKHLGCRLSLQAQNLFTISSYKGADPEFTLGGTLPPMRIFSAGIQLTF